jgi:hypothetical protein
MGKEGEKILFKGNRPKTLLKIKELAISGAQNELHFGGKKRQSKRKIWPKIDHFQSIE